MIVNSNSQNLVSDTGLSSSDKIALGVGVGIGIPALLAAIVGSYYGYRAYADKRRRQRTTS
jgi:hypothetical protein